jgi:uncharacterized protein YbaP (TraB family)
MKSLKAVLLPLILLSAVLTSPFAQGQATTSTNLHCVWRVAGASNTVYLVGSIHLLKPSDYPLAAPIEAAFTNSQIVAFETDIGAMDDPAKQMGILGKVMLPDDQTLEDQLSPGTWKMFTNQVDRVGLPLFMFNRFKPVMAAMTLELMEIQKIGVDPLLGLDKHYYQIAKDEGKQIVPLETVDFQLSLITDFNKEEGEAMMKSELKDLDNEAQNLDELMQCWRTGNAVKLESLLNDAMKDSPALYHRLVTNRNQNWIPRIQQFLSGNKNAVVIVGAAHLVGSDGVVELLKKKGFKVTQL